MYTHSCWKICCKQQFHLFGEKTLINTSNKECHFIDAFLPWEVSPRNQKLNIISPNYFYSCFVIIKTKIAFLFYKFAVMKETRYAVWKSFSSMAPRYCQVLVLLSASSTFFDFKFSNYFFNILSKTVKILVNMQSIFFSKNRFGIYKRRQKSYFRNN